MSQTGSAMMTKARFLYIISELKLFLTDRQDLEVSLITGNCAIYAQKKTPEKILREGKRWVEGEPYHFSNYGKHLQHETNKDNPAHYLSPLNRSFSRAIIHYRGLPLAPSRPLAGMLADMLLRMAPGGDILLQNSAVRSLSGWLPQSFFREHLPSVTVRRVSLLSHNWFRLKASNHTEDDLKALGSVYPFLAVNMEEYRHHWGEPRQASDLPFAISNLITPCSRGLVKSSVVCAMIKDAFGDKRLDGLDVGGGMGYVACELAGAGHRMVNVDIISRNIRMTEWLREICNVTERVGVQIGDMLQLDELQGEYDFICFLGSLLFCRDHGAANVLSAAARKLRPGGRIFLSENTVTDKDAPPSDYPKFEARQFHDLISSFAEPDYYDQYANRVHAEKARQSQKVFCALACGPA